MHAQTACVVILSIMKRQFSAAMATESHPVVGTGAQEKSRRVTMSERRLRPQEAHAAETVPALPSELEVSLTAVASWQRTITAKQCY